jgi:hypothetical protein
VYGHNLSFSPRAGREKNGTNGKTPALGLSVPSVISVGSVLSLLPALEKRKL